MPSLHSISGSMHSSHDPVAVEQVVAGAKRLECGLAILRVERLEEPAEDLCGALR